MSDNRVRLTLEEIQRRRELRQGYSWFDEREMQSLMMPEKRGGKVGKRPIGSQDQMLRRCPGSSQHGGVDFVRAVYAERTGQE
jgi:hypothetical protein